MQRTNIYLDDDQIRALKHVAAEERTTVADLVRQAVDAYLVRRLSDDQAWRERFDRLVERVRSRIPPDVTPEAIEQDITAARDKLERDDMETGR